jgi:integrase
MIEARTEEEELLLTDLVEWVHNSGAEPQDPLFSRYTQFPGKPRLKKICTPKMVVKVLKALVKETGLDPDEFSLHSLRKGCATQLDVHGIGLVEANARGNYARDSRMVRTVYNGNDTGRGALLSSSWLE